MAVGYAIVQKDNPSVRNLNSQVIFDAGVQPV